MAYGYRRQPMIIRKPPNFLEGLLGGMNVGVQQGIQRVMRRKEQQRDHANRIIEGFLGGKFPTGMAGTDVFQRYAEGAGISENPEIQALITTGREQHTIPPRQMQTPEGAMVTMPGVTPEEVPYEYARRMVAEKEATQKLSMYEAQRRIAKKVERESWQPLNVQLGNATNLYHASIRSGIPLDISFTNKETGLNVSFPDYYAELKKQQTEKLAKSKEHTDYLKAEEDFWEAIMQGDKALRRVKEGAALTIDFQGKTISIQEMLKPGEKTANPEQVWKRMMPLINKVLSNKFDVLKEKRRTVRGRDIVLPFRYQFDMDMFNKPDKYADEIEVITKFHSFIKGEIKSKEFEYKKETVEEPKESIQRNKVIPPKIPDDTKASLEEMTEQILSLKLINQGTGMAMTREDAEKEAKRILGIE